MKVSFPSTAKASQRGALMAAALMLTVVGGIALSAWASLLSARAVQVSYQEDVSRRRVSLENSRVIARQVLLQQGFQREDDLAAAATYTLTDGSGQSWGGTTHPGGWTNLNVFASAQDADSRTTVFPYNAGGLRPGDSYLETQTFERPAGLTDLDPHETYGFMKMTCPPLRGDLFTVYRRPDVAVSELDVYRRTNADFASWVVDGRFVIKDVESLFARTTPNPLTIEARSESLYIAGDNAQRLVRGTSINGSSMPPSNLSGAPTTGGMPSAGGSNVWLNDLDVLRNDLHPENSVWHTMEREEAAGRTGIITIDSSDWDYGAPDPPAWIEKQGLLGTPTYPPPRWPAGYDPEWPVLFVDMDHPNLEHLRILGAVRQVVFIGQPPGSGEYDAAALMAPLLVTIMPHPTLRAGVQDVRFVDANNRRWLLGFKGTLDDRIELYWEGASQPEPVPGRPWLSQNFHVWRGVMVNEYRKVFVNLEPSQNVRWTGGVMTNWLFKRRRSAPGFPRNESYGGLVFTLDSDPEPAGAAGPPFSSLLPKDGWVETYFFPITN